MAYEQRDNSGSIWVNDRKDEPVMSMEDDPWAAEGWKAAARDYVKDAAPQNGLVETAPLTDFQWRNRALLH